MENAKVIPFVFWQNNFVQNSIIPMVFSGTKIRLKAATWPAMIFLPGIFIWCYIQVKLAILIDNDDGILSQNYFANNATIFLWFFSGTKIQLKMRSSYLAP